MTLIDPLPPQLPIGPYLPPYEPLNNVAPLTYRDGKTFLRQLELLGIYVNETLVNFINQNFTELGADFSAQVNALIQSVNAHIDEQTAAVNAQLAAQDEAATEQLAEQDSNISAQLTAQNASNAAAIADLTTFVNESVQSIINSTIAVTDPVTLAIFNNVATNTRKAMDDAYEASRGLSVVKPVGGVLAYADIQAALTAAETSGKTVVAFGTITTSQTLTITSNADLGGLTINYTGTGTAVRVGKTNADTSRKVITTPQVVAANKTNTGWSQVVGTIGVDIVNVQASKLTVPYANNFEIGLRMYAISSGTAGNSYNRVYIGSLVNNMINLQNYADAGTGGYVNQNVYVGGRFQHFSNEGVSVVGTKHIHFKHLASVNADPNNNTFINPSIESPGVVEYALDIAGSLNIFINPRLEFTGGSPKVYWRATAYRNMIFGGFNNDSIVEVIDAGGFSNNIWGAQRMLYRVGGTAGGIILQNVTSDSAPDITTLSATSAINVDPATAYMLQIRSNVIAAKRALDAFDRARLNGSSGSLILGDGTVTPVAGLTGVGSTLLVNDGTTVVGPITDGASGTGTPADLGLNTSRRFRNASFSGYIKIGAVATANRPTAGSAGQGAMLFDTDLQKPIWSNGAVWKDATGATV